jgi:nicotinamidase/pyrazinamidase
VLNTALDAIAAGFQTVVVPEAMRAVDASPGDGARAIGRMVDAGAMAITVDGLR